MRALLLALGLAASAQAAKLPREFDEGYKRFHWGASPADTKSALEASGLEFTDEASSLGFRLHGVPAKAMFENERLAAIHGGKFYESRFWANWAYRRFTRKLGPPDYPGVWIGSATVVTAELTAQPPKGFMATFGYSRRSPELVYAVKSRRGLPMDEADVPVMVRLLLQPGVAITTHGIDILETIIRIGPKAEAAVPALEKLRADRDCKASAACADATDRAYKLLRPPEPPKKKKWDE